MAKNRLIIFMSFVFVSSMLGTALADDVKTTGYFPIKRGNYNTLNTASDTVLAANNTGTVSIGRGDASGEKLTVNASRTQPDVVVSGSLEAKNTIQIEVCSGCVGDRPVGRIYLDTRVAERPVDVRS
jgi:hypothetical protein